MEYLFNDVKRSMKMPKKKKGGRKNYEFEEKSIEIFNLENKEEK